ncbi:hypothetical protein ENUP19_0205G0028 [Entamoeba nuttalli]|uniref:Uncharacterized protein n=1 Tax=Entamoeba nuttalli TaxID=412467 RepID=A0ABQ0DNV0_9EUKA
MSIENEDKEYKAFNKGEKKRLVEKEEENNENEKRVKELEKVEEGMKEKEEMDMEIQIKEQTINKLTKDIIALKKKHANEINIKVIL